MNAISTLLWLHSAYWLNRKGITSLAETCYRNAASGKGKHAATASLKLTRQLLAQDHNSEAVTIAEQALARNPKQAQLWCLLGAARRRLAQMDGARDAYEQAIALDPDYAQAWCNLGEWWLVKDDLPTALAKFEQALKLQPDLPEALNNRVAVFYELGRFDDAETAAQAAILIYPEQAALHVNLGNILLHTGKARLALKSLRKALELDPASPEAHLGLSTLLGEHHRLAETLAFFEHEIAVKGESAQRLAALALAQQSKGDWLTAEATCKKILKMQPNNISALVTLGGCHSVRADHQGAIRLYERALAENPQMPGIYSSIAFNATYLPDISATELFAYHQQWATHFEAAHEKQRYCHQPSTDPHRPLRIGYVSGDFGTHPVGFLLRDVIAHHDRQQYAIYCYSMMRNSDNITAAIRENADAWIDALLMSDEELAEQINQDHIDILIDLSGHTAYNRLSTFALKPAPVQATWIGYFHSTGLESIDYFITDPVTTPPGCGQLFSETPVYLPHSRFCYSPPGPSPHPDMLEQYSEVDIALDPFPFNGGMTTLEALWMGVPVITVEGSTVVARQTVSALSNIGLADDLVFKDIDSYIAGAVALANNPSKLAELRGKIRPLMAASPLRQSEQFTRDLEHLYRRMWQAWCAGGRLKTCHE